MKYLYYKKYQRQPYEDYVRYNDLLQLFNECALKTRRELQQQIYLYKTVNGVMNNSPFLERVNFNFKKTALRTRELLTYSTPKTKMYSSSPLLQMSIMYNNITKQLPELDLSLPIYEYVRKLKYYFQIEIWERDGIRRY